MRTASLGVETSLLALALVAGCGHGKSPASSDGGSGAGGVAGGDGAAGSAADAGGDATGGGGGNNASVPACPDTPPLEGTDCAGQTCVYEDCVGAGRTVAFCHPAGSFEVTVTACTEAACGGAPASPCPMGSLCLEKPVDGGLTSTCLANPCGKGPITCACATCSGACSVVGSPTGITVTCQTP
jgi:hypothetical protein